MPKRQFAICLSLTSRQNAEWSQDIAAINLALIRPFHPPIHGMSVIAEAMYEELKSSSDLIKTNLASQSQHSLMRHIDQIGEAMRVKLKLPFQRASGAQVVYIDCNGDLRRLYAFLQLTTAVMLSFVILLRDQSYAFISIHRQIMRWLSSACSSRLRGIYFFYEMRNAFSPQYHLELYDDIIPNAAIISGEFE